MDKDYGPTEYDKSNKTLPGTQISPLYPVINVSQNVLSNGHLKCPHCNKTYKPETKCIIKLNVKKEIKHLIKTKTIYHLLIMTTIQQLPKQSNTFGRKHAIPSRQTPST